MASKPILNCVAVLAVIVMASYLQAVVQGEITENTAYNKRTIPMDDSPGWRKLRINRHGKREPLAWEDSYTEDGTPYDARNIPMEDSPGWRKLRINRHGKREPFVQADSYAKDGTPYNVRSIPMEDRLKKNH